MATASVSRRTFLKVSAAAGGGLLVSFALPATRRGDRPGAAAAAASFTPNGFVRIDRDGRVTLVMHQVEMGQGDGRRRGEVELVEPVSTLDAVHDIPRWAGLALKRHRAFAL